jgi:hypothetical protein
MTKAELVDQVVETVQLPKNKTDAVITRWKRNKKVAVKPGFEGVRKRILPWNGLRVVHIGFTSWRTVPPLFSSCLARIGAPDRDAQQPFCYASYENSCRALPSH